MNHRDFWRKTRNERWSLCPIHRDSIRRACYSPAVMLLQFMTLIDILRAFPTVIGYDTGACDGLALPNRV
ncbi:MAG TPA: hypothetical protein DCY79_15655 [Planctomycetaceae bacterium]|nr:hypothetical protein [Blastopirellula sp.]HAY81239.1 hypothetical protein [Planctomycetaceae bacterium]